MVVLEIKQKKGIRKKKLPMMFVDDTRPVHEEPLYQMIKTKYHFELGGKFEPYTDVIIPDSIFDLLCSVTNRDPDTERTTLVSSYWESIQKVLDK
jgi:hypothetical protein